MLRGVPRRVVAGLVAGLLTLTTIPSCKWEDILSRAFAPAIVPLRINLHTQTRPGPRAPRLVAHPRGCGGASADVKSAQLKVATAARRHPHGDTSAPTAGVCAGRRAVPARRVHQDDPGAPRGCRYWSPSRRSPTADPVSRPHRSRNDGRQLDLAGGASVNYRRRARARERGYLYALPAACCSRSRPPSRSSCRCSCPSWTRRATNENTAFNGAQATDDGDLIMKGSHPSHGRQYAGNPAPGPRDRPRGRARLESTPSPPRAHIANIPGRIPVRSRPDVFAALPSRSNATARRQLHAGVPPTQRRVDPGSGRVHGQRRRIRQQHRAASDDPDCFLFGETASGEAPPDQCSLSRPRRPRRFFFLAAGDRSNPALRRRRRGTSSTPVSGFISPGRQTRTDEEAVGKRRAQGVCRRRHRV